MSETFLYFAYGSNMSTRRLERRVGKADKIAIGYVSGRTLTFDKRSQDRLGDSSGKCDCQKSANQEDRVWGVVFRARSSEMTRLDRAEGLGHGYHVENLTVEGSNASEVSETKIRAYVADPQAKDPSLQPYHWYKEYVLSGAVAHNLPPDYVRQFIAAVQSKADPNQPLHDT
jgi:gamma-glutamylcyclotransferase